jgi:hypothetical protein
VAETEEPETRVEPEVVAEEQSPPAAEAEDTTPPEEPEPKPAAKSRKRKRASVPSWDEIMFGSPTPKGK